MSKLKENESIEIMKDYIQDFTCDGGKYPYLVDSMKLIIRLVEEQQKEIEELRQANEVFKRYTVNCRELEIETNNVLEDKIKDKIKDLKNNLKSKEEQNEYFETLAKIEILEELLRW